ncbi:MAG: hypothetical protein IOB05_20780 [Burkholderia sp.]|nr:hypothetical protein [Burkholderia sp.]
MQARIFLFIQVSEPNVAMIVIQPGKPLLKQFGAYQSKLCPPETFPAAYTILLVMQPRRVDATGDDAAPYCPISTPASSQPRIITPTSSLSH